MLSRRTAEICRRARELSAPDDAIRDAARAELAAMRPPREERDDMPAESPAKAEARALREAARGIR